MKKPSELIREVGWCQCYYSKKNAEGIVIGYCLVGAVEAALADFPSLRTDCYVSLSKITDEMGIGNILNWNDNPIRKKEEVIFVLERVGF